MKRKGQQFMWNEHLGYILTCPSNLGTGLRAGVHIKLPLLAKVEIKKLCTKPLNLRIKKWEAKLNVPRITKSFKWIIHIRAKPALVKSNQIKWDICLNTIVLTQMIHFYKTKDIQFYCGLSSTICHWNLLMYAGQEAIYYLQPQKVDFVEIHKRR